VRDALLSCLAWSCCLTWCRAVGWSKCYSSEVGLSVVVTVSPKSMFKKTPQKGCSSLSQFSGRLEYIRPYVLKGLKSKSVRESSFL